MKFDLGYKVLVWPAAGPPTSSVPPCLCSFVFKCDTAKRATLLLIATIPAAQNVKAQFVLQYDVDMMDRAKLENGSQSVTQSQLDEIPFIKGKRSTRTRFDFKTLHLTTTDAPPLWCAAGTPLFSPRLGNEPAFQQFVNLAKSNDIYIVLDLNGIRQEHKNMFRAFSKAAKNMEGFPVKNLLLENGLRKASWEIFAPSITDGAPPAYGAKEEGKGDDSRTRKRLRQGSSSSPVQPPRHFRQSSAGTSDHEHSSHSDSSDKTIPFTPDKEAEYFRRALGFGHQAELVNAAVKTQLSAQLSKAVEAAVDTAVTSQLRPVLQATLPKIVEALFVPSPPGSPLRSVDSDGNLYPALPPLSPLAEMFLPHLRSHLTAQVHLQQKHILKRFKKLAYKTFAQLEDSASEDRARAHAEFEDWMEDLKAELSLLTRDAVDDLWREGQALVEKGNEACERLGEDVDGHLGTFVDRFDAMIGVHGLKKLVAREVRRQLGGRTNVIPKRRTVSRSNVSKAKERKGGRRKRGLLGGPRVAKEEWEDV